MYRKSLQLKLALYSNLSITLFHWKVILFTVLAIKKGD
jgi:hypothetical protein